MIPDGRLHSVTGTAAKWWRTTIAWTVWRDAAWSMAKKRKKKREESEWERRERELRSKAEEEARQIEAGDFMCPLCQRYVNPADWWTHYDWNVYVDPAPDDLTLFHKRCAVPIPERNKEWIASLRALYNKVPIEPGDYVRLKQRRRPPPASQTFRVVGIYLDPHTGITEDNPEYLLDPAGFAPENTRFLVKQEDVEWVGRPYLKAQDSI